MKLVAEQAPDNAAERGSALMGLLQTDLFEALLQFQEAADQDDESISPPIALRCTARRPRPLPS